MIDSLQSIVVVDDSRTQAELVKMVLEDAGYVVTTACNGAEALQLIQKERPKLIISDIQMPVMDGYELCRRVKADPELSAIPVLLLTAESDPKETLKALQSGADNFLYKPCGDEHLVSRVRQMLWERSCEDHAPLKSGIEVTFQGQKFFVSARRERLIEIFDEENVKAN